MGDIFHMGTLPYSFSYQWFIVTQARERERLKVRDRECRAIFGSSGCFLHTLKLLRLVVQNMVGVKRLSFDLI